MFLGVFESNGLSKLAPTQIYGRDSEGRKVVAFYIPPIVEIHGDHAVLVDGMHRSYICGSAGTTVNAVHVNRVDAELPFDIITWDDVRVVNEKPPINERYRGLRNELFRDLSVVGIDG